MRTSTLVSLLVLILCELSDSYCKTYYTGSNGSDSNSGSVGQPWQTIGKANRTLAAGDTVFIRGGSYDEAVQPVNSGSPGSVIVYIAYKDELPVLTGSAGVSLTQGKSFIVVDGLRLQDNIDGVIIENSSNIIVQRCAIIGTKAWQAVQLNNAAYCKILNNFVDRQDPKPGYGESGDGIALVGKSTNNLIDGNTVTGCYHVGITCAYSGQFENIIRNNRTYMLHTGYSLQNGVERTVFERNVAYYIGRIREDWGGHALQLTGSNNIVRFNVLYDDTSGGTGHDVSELVSYYAVDEFGKSYDVRNNRTAHNTFYGETDEVYNKMVLRLSNWSPNTVVTGNEFKNNIIADGTWDQVGEDNAYGAVGSFSSVYDGNLIRRNTSGEVVIGHYGTDFNLNLTLTSAKVNKPDVWWTGNIEGDPKFANTSGQGGRKDFSLLEGSAAIDAAAPLTLTTNSGSNSTVLRVTDAEWFCDGFGIADGDLIRIGGGVAVRIASIDYSSNTITLSTPTSWATGARVDYDYSGNQPDIGALEFGGTPPSPKAAPPPPPLVFPSDGAVDIPTDLTFTWGQSNTATTYQFQLATDQAFSSVVVDQNGLTGGSLDVRGLMRRSSYYWRIRASNEVGPGSYSAVRVFTTVDTTAAVPGAAPQPMSPPDGTMLERTELTFQWAAVPGADVYDLEVSTDVGFGSVVTGGQGIAATSYSLTLPGAGNQTGQEYFWRVRGRSANGAGPYSPTFTFIVAQSASPLVPLNFQLDQNYPNPFNPETMITYELPELSAVSLSVYNFLGQLIRTLAEGIQPAGRYSLPFDASALASGVYFYVLQAGSYVETRKMVVLR